MDSDARILHERFLREAVLNGNAEAWAAWYDQSFADVYRFALWRCGGNRDWAEELVQESWLIAVRRLAQFDPEKGSFCNWLRGILHNLQRNMARQRACRPRIEPLNADLASNRDCDDRSAERSDLVACALLALPEQFEFVLRAKYLDGLSVAEIAELQGQTPKGVESLLSRARQAFREAFNREHL